MMMMLARSVPPAALLHVAPSSSQLLLSRASPISVRMQHHHAAPSSEEAALAALSRWHTTAAENNDNNHDNGPSPPQVHIVAADEDGLRLTAVGGRRFAQLGSKSQAEAAVKRQTLRLNGEVVEKSRKVREGDELTLRSPETAAPSAARLASLARFVTHLEGQGLRTVHEDDDLAIVYKPPGIHTKAGQNARYMALEDALPAIVMPPPPGALDALVRPQAVHRLDVPVQGLCVVAKTRAASTALGRQFAERRVAKVYHALLVGEPAAGVRTIRTPVGGLPAETSIEVLDVTAHEHWGALSWVRLRPHTGRRHQLRVHAAEALGCPIVGDDLYWGLAAETRRAQQGGVAGSHINDPQRALPPLRKGSGLFLQSCGVTLEHPTRGDGTTVQVMVREAPKFAALRTKARRAAEYQAAEIED